MINDSQYNQIKDKIKYQIVNIISVNLKNENLKTDVLENKKDLFKTFEAIDDVVAASKENPHLEYYDLLEQSKIGSAILQDLNLGKGDVGSSFGLTANGVMPMLDFNLMKATRYATTEQLEMMKGSEYQVEEHKRDVMNGLYQEVDHAIQCNPNIEKLLNALSIMDNNRSHTLQLEHKEFLESAKIPKPEKIIFGEEEVLILCEGGKIKTKPIEFVEDLDIFDSDYKDTYNHEYVMIDDLEIQTLNLSTRINVNFQYFDENEGESQTAFISYDLAQGKFMTNQHFDSLNFTDSDIRQLESDVVEQVKKASLEYIKEQSFKHTDVACKVTDDGIPVYVAPMAEISNTDFKGTLLSFNHYHNDMREQYYNIDGDHQELHFSEMSSRKAELALQAFDYTYQKFANVLAVKNHNDEDCSLYQNSENQFKVIETSEVALEQRDKIEEQGFALPELRSERRERRKLNRP